RRLGEPGDDPVAQRKVPRERLRPRNELAHEGAAAGRDPFEELAVLGRIDLVDAAAEDRDRGSAPPESASMGGGVDAARTARDDLDPRAREVLPERPRLREP